MRGRVLAGIGILIFLFAVVAWFFTDRDQEIVVEEVRFDEIAVMGNQEDLSSGSAELEMGDAYIESDTGVILSGQEQASANSTISSEARDPLDEQTSPGIIPSQINLAVPFTSQAPHANWDFPYQEFCEEASAYMVWLYYEGYSSGQVDVAVADAHLLEMKEAEERLLGTYLDTTAEQTSAFIKAFYGLNAYTVENPTIEDLKAQLSKGFPVIVPAAGRELGNPNFSGEGPLYHMLVLRGYTQDVWITNDPGTRHGQGYIYDIDVIMNAMGDWNDGDPAHGASIVIFVEP